jgi:serine/threonine protein kinase
VLNNSNPLFEDESFLIDWKLKVLDGIILGIYWIHKNGYSHRDLKPSNIMLTNGAVPMISDFGFAKEFSENTQSMVGTPMYMAPEIRLESPNYTHKVDVYSLGIIIFEVLNMHSRVNIQMMSRNDIINYCDNTTFPLMSVERNILEIYCMYFQELVKKMLEVNPDERPEMIDVIRGWVEFRQQAKQKQNEYETNLYNYLSNQSEEQFSSNFLVGFQSEPMEIDEFGEDTRMDEEIIYNSNQTQVGAPAPLTEITLFTITTQDPGFSAKCAHFFDIIKGKFQPMVQNNVFVQQNNMFLI